MRHSGWRTGDLHRQRPYSHMSFPGRSYAWSPEGEHLATVTADRVEVHTLSRRLLFRKSIPELHRNQHNGLVWTDNNHVLIGGTGTSSGRAISVDITSTTEQVAVAFWRKRDKML
jgi:hypothetical protein